MKALRQRWKKMFFSNYFIAVYFDPFRNHNLRAARLQTGSATFNLGQETFIGYLKWIDLALTMSSSRSLLL